MKYSELPKEYKNLVLSIVDEAHAISEDHLDDMFTWEHTPQKEKFWRQVHEATNIEELPKIIEVSLQRKLEILFSSGHSIQIQNTVKRVEGEWESRIIWEHVQLPGDNVIKTCKWEGFETPEECIDDCLKYLQTLNKK